MAAAAAARRVWGYVAGFSPVALVSVWNQGSPVSCEGVLSGGKVDPKSVPPTRLDSVCQGCLSFPFSTGLPSFTREPTATALAQAYTVNQIQAEFDKELERKRHEEELEREQIAHKVTAEELKDTKKTLERVVAEHLNGGVDHDVVHINLTPFELRTLASLVAIFVSTPIGVWAENLKIRWFGQLVGAKIPMPDMWAGGMIRATGKFSLLVSSAALVPSLFPEVTDPYAIASLGYLLSIGPVVFCREGQMKRAIGWGYRQYFQWVASQRGVLGLWQQFAKFAPPEFLRVQAYVGFSFHLMKVLPNPYESDAFTRLMAQNISIITAGASGVETLVVHASELRSTMASILRARRVEEYCQEHGRKPKGKTFAMISDKVEAVVQRYKVGLRGLRDVALEPAEWRAFAAMSWRTFRIMFIKNCMAGVVPLGTTYFAGIYIKHKLEESEALAAVQSSNGVKATSPYRPGLVRLMRESGMFGGKFEARSGLLPLTPKNPKAT